MSKQRSGSIFRISTSSCERWLNSCQPVRKYKDTLGVNMNTRTTLIFSDSVVHVSGDRLTQATINTNMCIYYTYEYILHVLSGRELQSAGEPTRKDRTKGRKFWRAEVSNTSKYNNAVRKCRETSWLYLARTGIMQATTTDRMWAPAIYSPPWRYVLRYYI